MEYERKIRVIFSDQAEEVFSEILKKYQIQETLQEFERRAEQGTSSKLTMAKKVIKAFSAEIISAEDMENSLSKVLNIDLPTSKNMSGEIKTRLISLLIKAPSTRFDDPKFREETTSKFFVKKSKDLSPQDILLQKVKSNPAGEATPTPAAQRIGVPPTSKNVDVKSVEENAEKLKKEREATARPGTVSGLQRKSQPDQYREPTE